MLKRIYVLFVLCTVICGAALPVYGAESYDIGAHAAIVMEYTSGMVLYQFNQDEQLPMASTTKIMTALLTLEQPDLDTYFVVDSAAIQVEGSSMGLVEGDQVSLRALAYGMLMSSGNDAANAAAVRVAGSIDAFVELMNTRAAQIGMKNTSFATPSGLDAENHYSTAYDMALLARYALANADFAEICAMKQGVVEFGNPPYKRYLTNHNKLLSYYSYTIGMKTGYTKKAGRCLVSAACKDGVTLICVTLGDSNDWVNHENLYETYFGQVRHEVLPVPENGITIDVAAGLETSVSAFPSYQPEATLLTEDMERLEMQVYRTPILFAPVNKGDVVGEVRYLLDGIPILTVPLVAASNVAAPPVEKNWWEQLWEWAAGG